MERHILHLDLDTFFVSVERLFNSKLCGVPVIVGGSSERGVVASCSYEARKFGIHSAMSSKIAARLCPQAIFIKGNYEAYDKYSKIVTEILKEQAPVLEKASIDEHYLDLTGIDKYFGVEKWATALRQKVIKETGLPISFGLSSNKTVSKVATGLAKPNGQLFIKAGEEKAFLAPLSVKKIPMVGDKAYKILCKSGIEKIGDIQRISPEALVQLLGDSGIVIWRKCNGIDNSGVRQFLERGSLSKETTFEKDTIDTERIKRNIAKKADELAFNLRKAKMLASCIAIKIRYSNFHTDQLQQKIVPTSSTSRLTFKGIELFEKLYSPTRPVRLVGLKYSDLVLGNEQPDLFDETVTQINLNKALDGIRIKFGKDAAKRAICL